MIICCLKSLYERRIFYQSLYKLGRKREKKKREREKLTGLKNVGSDDFEKYQGHLQAILPVFLVILKIQETSTSSSQQQWIIVRLHLKMNKGKKKKEAWNIKLARKNR